MTDLVDARGVIIEPGDKVIYGFGVGRSVAMAEGEVMGKHPDHTACLPPCQDEVSLTASGRIRVRIIRRSYSSGTKPTVDVMPDRLVVLKPIEAVPVDPESPGPHVAYALPASPLPTQADANANERRRLIDVYRDRLDDDAYPSWANSRAEYHHWCRERISELESEEAEG